MVWLRGHVTVDQDTSLSAQTFKYWEIFLSWLFKYPSRCYELKRDEAPLLYENPSEELFRFGKTYRLRFASKGIICRVTPSFKDIEKVVEVLKDIYDTIDNPLLSEWATSEVLAKVMAYRNLKEGYKIPLPIVGEDGRMEMTTYVVDRVFDLWNKIRAFGLIRFDGGKSSPIILFRGTDFSIMREGGRASMISDLDPQGPGWSLFQQGQTVLRAWFKKVGGGVRVIGHSLGGAVGAYTLIHEKKWISQKPHELSYLFNSPGISEEFLKKWNQIEEKPPLRGFICRGDLVSKFGKLFGDVYELSLEKPLSPMRAHEMLFFSERRIYLHQVNLKGENLSSSRQFYSKILGQTSSIIYKFGLKFLFPH